LRCENTAIKTPSYIPELDGLRALAILAVLFSHLPLYWQVEHPLLGEVAHRGWIGVDLFFVLSGFLITGILLDARGEPGYYRNFYARRALRIWPLYYAVLLVAIFVFPLLQPHLRPLIQMYPWRWYFLYVQNFAFGQAGIPVLVVTWSLAIEEQFYLAWPLVISGIAGLRLRNLLIALLVCAPLVRLLMLWTGQDPGSIFTYTFSRMDGIAAGALLAWWMRSSSFTPERLRRWGALALAVGGVASAALLTWKQGSVWVFSALAAAFAGLLMLVLDARRRPGWGSRLLAWLPMRSTGKISYGLYLLHPMAFALALPVLRALHGAPLAKSPAGDLLTSLTCLALVYAVATVSWFAFESPLLKLKAYFAGPKTAAAPHLERPLAARAE
jgi:peptidoglycan/LPS O-acetylase OafA/YrhL